MLGSVISIVLKERKETMNRKDPIYRDNKGYIFKCFDVFMDVNRHLVYRGGSEDNYLIHVELF